MEMEYAILGRTGLRISRIGLGGGGIAQLLGATTRAEAIRTVRRALDLGISFFDVSPGYGNGEAEAVLGLGLESRRHEAIISTKVVFPPGDLDDVDGFVAGQVDTCLQRLRTDIIDVLHVHNPCAAARDDVRRSLSVEDVLGPVLHAFRKVQQADSSAQSPQRTAHNHLSAPAPMIR